MIKPADCTLEIDQGSYLEKKYKLTLADGTTPVDLRHYEGRMQIRPYPGRDPVYLDLGTDEIIIDGVNGTISFFVDAERTALLDFDEASFDLELYPSGDPKRAFKLIRGQVKLTKESTL